MPRATGEAPVTGEIDAAGVGTFFPVTFFPVTCCVQYGEGS